MSLSDAPCLTGTNLNQMCENIAQSCENIAQNYKNNGDEAGPSRARAKLDKLAQSGKNAKIENEVFRKRAKAKYITNGFIIDLASLNSTLKKSYWNTFHCVENLLYQPDQNKIIGQYCKNRWCLVCNRIRTGKLMNLYFDEFSKYDDLYFVTLTIRNIPENRLPNALKHMQGSWEAIRIKFKDAKMSFDGIRKNECTYSMKENTYHPHMHVVVIGRKQAEKLLSDWQDIYNIGCPMVLNVSPVELPFYAYVKGQDIRKCDQNTLKELFKYFTKVVKRDKGTPKNEYPVFIHPLDVMNRAYYKMRVFNSFGKFRNLKIEDAENIEEIKAEEVEQMFDGCVWEWVQDQSDWVSEYGELLTNNDYYSKIKVKIK